MKLIEEMQFDMDFWEPKILLSQRQVIVENVKSIVMISETSLTVECGKSFVTVNGSDFVLKEIYEGRLLVEGNIQGAEFLITSGEDKNRRVQDR